MHHHLRVARPTARLDDITRLYRDGLGFEVLGGFEDHAGFDGVMLGHPGAGYHLEFTLERGRPAGTPPDAEHLLVFYVVGDDAWEEACARAAGAGFHEVPAHNPYWDAHGRTFVDLDGYRVVLHRGAWR